MALNRVSLAVYFTALAFFIGLEISALILEYRHLGINPLFLRDFSNYWGGAHILFEGDPLSVFDQNSYFSQLVALYGENYTWHNWSYPPSFLLFCAPLYFMGYHLAMAVFLFGTLGLFVFAAHRFVLEHAPDVAGGKSPWTIPVFTLLMLAAILCNLRYTQNGFLTSGLLLLGFAYWSRKPVLAGIFLGLLTVKPQLGILVPFLLLLDRNWLAIASATVTALALIAVSSAVLGVQAWLDYVEITLPHQSRIMTVFGEDQPYLTMMLSPFSGMRTLGINGSPAWFVHALFVIPALALGFWTIVKSTDSLSRFAALLIMSFVVSPYSFNYDAGVLSVACASLGLRYRARATQSGEIGILADLRFRTLYFLAVLPVASGLITELLFPVSPPALLFGLFLLSPLAGRLFVPAHRSGFSPAG